MPSVGCNRSSFSSPKPFFPCGFACSSHLIFSLARALVAVASIDRLVPIELPTRRRRVFRIVAMTASVAVCLVLRAVVLVWAADKAIYVNDTVRCRL